MSIHNKLKFKTLEGKDIKLSNVYIDQELEIVEGFETLRTKGGVLIASIIETCNPRYSMAITQVSGAKPYAVKTSDSMGDNLGSYNLAQVQVRECYNIVFMLNDTSGREPKTTVTLRVTGIERSKISVTVIHKDLSSSTTIPRVLRDSVIHLSNIVDKYDCPTPLVDKYSYNTKRVVRYALLRYDEGKGLIGEREIRGAKRTILFNRKALKGYELEDGQVYLCRIYYSSRFESKDVIVRGHIVKTDDVYNVSLNDALRFSRSPDDAAKRIKKAVLTSGRSVVVQYNSMGVLRMLYNVKGTIKSFNLSEYECKLIEEISDIA